MRDFILKTPALLTALGSDAKGEPSNKPLSLRTKSLIIRLCHHHCIVRFGAMVGKVFVAQTQVRGTQQEHDTSAQADDASTFLNIMTERCSGGAISWIAIKPHSFECNSLSMRLAK